MALVRGLSLACACAILAGSLSRAATARGDDEGNPPERELAAALFKEGRRLLDEGKVVEACTKFAESERLDPGGGTLLNLAECHRRQGRAASAWTEFTEALAQARRDGRADRSDIAASRVAELEPQLSRLSVVVPPAADRVDLTVTLDHAPLRRPAWGLAVPLDPGAHTVQASAPGCKPWTAEIAIGPAHDLQSVAVPPLEPAPRELAPTEGAPVPIASAAPTIAPPPSPAPEVSSVSPWRDGAMVGAAALGAVGVGLGSYFGLNAITLNQHAASECPAGRCTNQAQSTSANATSSADASTVSFAVGAAGVAAAAALFFTRHASAVHTVAIGATPTGAWLGCQGEF
jgi:hypothetical protein